MPTFDFEDATLIDTRLDEPKDYQVIFYNDDYTSFKFVMFALETIFNKSYEDAYAITHNIHTRDKMVVAVYRHEIAEMKTNQVLELALEHEQPLLVTFEAA